MDGGTRMSRSNNETKNVQFKRLESKFNTKGTIFEANFDVTAAWSKVPPRTVSLLFTFAPRFTSNSTISCNPLDVA